MKTCLVRKVCELPGAQDELLLVELHFDVFFEESELDEALLVLHQVRELAHKKDWTSLVSLQEESHEAAKTCQKVATIRAYAKERSTHPGQLIVTCLRAEGLPTMDTSTRTAGMT